MRGWIQCCQLSLRCENGLKWWKCVNFELLPWWSGKTPASSMRIWMMKYFLLNLIWHDETHTLQNYVYDYRIMSSIQYPEILIGRESICNYCWVECYNTIFEIRNWITQRSLFHVCWRHNRNPKIPKQHYKKERRTLRWLGLTFRRNWQSMRFFPRETRTLNNQLIWNKTSSFDLLLTNSSSISR